MAYNIFNRRLKKKSQLTLFIIAGFLIFITVIAIFYITEYVTREQLAAQQLSAQQFNDDVEAIKNYVQSCVRDTGYDALIMLGNQGGYIDTPELIRHTGTSYWYLDQLNIQPLLEEIRDRYETYVDENVHLCSDFDIFRNQGFEIRAEDVSTEVDFATETVFMNVSYPLTIKKGDFEKEIDYFYKEYNIRFRKMYELASQINYRHFNPRFNVYKPLELVYSLDFDVSNTPYVGDKLIYSIVDRTRLESGLNNYTFKFAARFGNSTLPRRSALWDNSASIPSTRFFVTYSVDRMARLFVLPDIFIHLNGNSVEEVTATQSYPDNATGYGIFYSREYNLGNSSSKQHDRTWKLTNPVYSFEPTGTKFSQPLPMFFYWDNETNPNQGEVGILYTNGDSQGWHPIDSTPVYNQSYVWTRAYGFSNYTVVDCAVQDLQEHNAKSTIKPKWPCFLNLLIDIVLIVLVIVFPPAGIIAFLVMVAIGAAISMATSFILNAIFPPTEDQQPDVIRVPPIIPSTGNVVAITGFETASPSSDYSGPMGTIPEGSTNPFQKIMFDDSIETQIDKGLEPYSDSESFMGVDWANVGVVVAFSGLRWVLGRFSWDTKIECVEFTPTCDQNVTIVNENVGGTGKCSLKSGFYEGGHTYKVCAIVKKCDTLKRYTCQSCSTECTVQFK